MRLNGETQAQMDYAYAVKKAGGVSLNPEDGTDTSVDQKWEYEDKPHTDMYVLVTTVIWQCIKLPVFLLLMLILCFVPTLICRLYISVLPEPLDRVPRSRCFYFWFAVTLITSLPAILLIIVSLLLDFVGYYFWSLLYCTATCHWSQYMAGLEKIRPFRGGPSIIWQAPDIFVCVMGQSMRQGFLETTYIVSMMWVLMPWLKYYVCCNPFIYNLDHRLVQQISTSMEELGTADEVAEECRNVISRARHRRERAHRIDLWSFVPHYPYPPPDRRWAIGMQAGGSSYPGKFTLLVHSTHADAKAPSAPVPSSEQFVLSNSIARPVYRVMLWYSNPFHFLTGFVEASISTGEPSQPHKFHGGEHPMWLVSGRSALTSGRDSFTGSGLIDWFFDYWLPVFVHEVRFSMLRQQFTKAGKSHQESFDEALKIANSKYQEVTSKDGISEAKELMGREQYEGKDALSDYQREGEIEHKDKAQKFDSWVGGLNETKFGQASQRWLMDDDIHDKEHWVDRTMTLQPQTGVAGTPTSAPGADAESAEEKKGA